MRFLATAFLCLFAAVTFASQSEAKRAPRASVPVVDCFTDRGYGTCGAGGSHWFDPGNGVPVAKTKRTAKHKTYRTPRSVAAKPAGFGDGHLVSKARAYMGQTAREIGLSRHTLWCAAFIAEAVAPHLKHRVRNPNMARDYAALPRVAPQVGAIAVLSRGKRGGHIGIVSGFDPRGNPIIVSGNHNRRVGEAAYPAHRVLAYVSGA